MLDRLTVRRWPDPVLDTIGHDPRSLYVETFWLPTLGPTAVLLLRHLAAKFDESPKGIELPVADTSQALGVGQGPRHGGNVEVKYNGPDGVMVDVSETGWVGTSPL